MFLLFERMEQLFGLFHQTAKQQSDFQRHHLQPVMDRHSNAHNAGLLRCVHGLDPSRKNLFMDHEDELTPMLRHSVAGLQATMLESMLIFAPHLNSWRRFTENSYAPTSPTWGRNNRSVAIRIPAGSAAGRHLEHRTAGVDANPYLVGAVVLAGMHKGILDKRDPGPESTAYAPSQDDSLPPDWRSAIESTAASAFLRKSLGNGIIDVFLALKRAEYRRFANEITLLEHKLYGETI